MSSILTNSGAITALQTLSKTNTSLLDTQNMISSGKEVTSAKDDAAVWAISKTMGADIAGFEQISESLSLGESTLAVASKAAEDITDYIIEIQTKVIAAQGASDSDRALLQADITALVTQIDTTANAAQFNGTNIVNDDTAAGYDILASLNRATDGSVTTSDIEVTSFDLTSTGDLADLANIDVETDDASAATALGLMDGLLDVATEAAASLGSSAGRVEMQAEFVATLTDTLTLGVSALVDADMEEASAKLSALQVQQDLGVQALSIANEAPETLMTLFR
jgi:flagellin